MRLTTKGRFAVTAMIDVALRQHDGPVSLAGVAERRKISLSYLEQLFGRLRRSRLVVSTRGPGGGYTLAKPLGAVSVADIICAVDESLDATNCFGRADCSDGQPCMTHHLWSGLNQRMLEYLRSVSLDDLVRAQQGASCADDALPEAVQLARPRKPRRAGINQTA